MRTDLYSRSDKHKAVDTVAGIYCIVRRTVVLTPGNSGDNSGHLLCQPVAAHDWPRQILQDSSTYKAVFKQNLTFIENSFISSLGFTFFPFQRNGTIICLLLMYIH